MTTATTTRTSTTTAATTAATTGPAEYTIGEVAERTGISTHTLRFYEREGIFATEVRRRAGGQRVFTDHDLDWLTVCQVLRGSGMPISQMRRYAELVRAGSGTEQERLELMREHRTRVQDQLAELDRSLDLISHKVRIYEDIVDRGSSDHSCNLADDNTDERHPRQHR
jgi:DNA-binding transcriptional MerR regulator